MFTRVF